MKSAIRYCVFVRGIVSSKSKKHAVVSRLSGKSEYRVVVDLTCELVDTGYSD